MVYALWPIYVYLTLDPKHPDEPNEALIISTPLV